MGQNFRPGPLFSIGCDPVERPTSIRSHLPTAAQLPCCNT